MMKFILFLLIISLSFQSSFADVRLTPRIQETAQRYHPVMDPEGMVASQEALATLIGRRILKKGGNAVDAAVAMSFALAVTLPRAGNLGGGGFMLVWLNQSKQAVAINYREKAPLAADADMFLQKDGKIDMQRATMSSQAVAVPGTVAGLALALKRYGTLTLKDVMQPAIQLAENGIRVSYDLAHSIERGREQLMTSPAAQKIFFKADGKDYQPGDLLIQKDLATSLKLIAAKGPDAFYRGEIAKKIIRFMKKNDGLITKKDLENYQAEILLPIVGNYEGYPIYSMPPPSSGGVTLIEMLNVLEKFPLKILGPNNAAYFHLLIETMNLAYNDRNTYLGDPDFVKAPLHRLLSKEYASKLAKKINSKKHMPARDISSIKVKEKESRETTQISVIDKDGNMVTSTYTLNFSFGNGHVVPGTGILLNNEMADFSLKPGEPNPFGLVEAKANAIAPAKRPLSSMTPTFVLAPDGTPFLATGSPGGSRIITVVLQIILNVIDFHFNIATAVNMPRVHSQLWPDKMYVEEGISSDTQVLLEKMGHDVVTIAAMGSAQTIAHKDNTVMGAADPRRAGAMARGVAGMDFGAYTGD